MRLLGMLRSLVVVAALVAGASADRAHVRLRYSDAAIAEVRRRCGGNAVRWYCRAAGWADGDAAPLPFDKPLIGRWLSKGEPGAKQRALRKLDEEDAVVALVVGGTQEHPTVVLHELETSAELRAGVTRVLEGKAAGVTLPDAARAELAALRPSAPLVAVDDEWFWDEGGDDVRLRYVDGSWIAILSPPSAAARAYPDARLIYVLTSSWN